MKLTVLGILVLPLSLIWALRPLRLVQIALVAAVFEAGAALVIGGGFGLPLAMVPGLLFIAYIIMQYALGMRYAAEGPVLRAVIPLLALLFYALLSVLLLPDAFAGTVMVWPQKADPIQPGLVPLAFNSGNVTQTLYLAMNITITVATALFLTHSKVSYRGIICAYLLGGYVVVGLAFWQFASRIAGVPFPDDVLYSNPGWAIVEQNLGGVPRIQASFSEPAGLAFYLSGLCFCCLWLIARRYRVMAPSLLLVLAVVAMLLSTSTTGIVTLLLGLPLLTVLTGLRSDASGLAQLMKTVAVLALSGAIAIGPVFVLKPSLLQSVDQVVTSTLSKGDSESYTERSGIDAAAVATVGASYGLGVGWGSFRASSLLPGLLANGGIFGVLMVLWLFARVARLVSKAAANAPEHSGRVLVDGFAAALCGQLCAALLSAPTIGSLAFFLQLGCVIGAAARMSVEPSSAAVAGQQISIVTPRGNVAAA
jgi:hypothetical protein